MTDAAVDTLKLALEEYLRTRFDDATQMLNGCALVVSGTGVVGEKVTTYIHGNHIEVMGLRSELSLQIDTFVAKRRNPRNIEDE